MYFWIGKMFLSSIKEETAENKENVFSKIFVELFF
jgi:hypothetical protein